VRFARARRLAIDGDIHAGDIEREDIDRSGFDDIRGADVIDVCVDRAR
jgi:hypothetical protein